MEEVCVGYGDEVSIGQNASNSKFKVLFCLILGDWGRRIWRWSKVLFVTLGETVYGW